MLDGNFGNRDDDRPCVEEAYQTAGNTSNLTVEADRKGAGDILIAAGWSASRIGMALLRLHSEFDASEKPSKPTKESIQALVGTFQRALPGEVVVGKPVPLTHAKAFQYATAWHAHEVAMLLGKLKALPAVREQVTLQALRWGMGRSADPVSRSDRTQLREQDAAMLKHLRQVLEAAKDDEEEAAAAQADLNIAITETNKRRQEEDAEDFARASEKVAAVIRYWLDQTCNACHGLKWQLIPGTPSLSGRPCRPCGGGGFGQVPHGQGGKRLANFIDDCVSRARSAIGRDLSNMRTAPNKVVYKAGGYEIVANKP